MASAFRYRLNDETELVGSTNVQSSRNNSGDKSPDMKYPPLLVAPLDKSFDNRLAISCKDKLSNLFSVPTGAPNGARIVYNLSSVGSSLMSTAAAAEEEGMTAHAVSPNSTIAADDTDRPLTSQLLLLEELEEDGDKELHAVMMSNNGRTLLKNNNAMIFFYIIVLLIH